MKNFKQIFLYIVFIIITTGFFLYYLFPIDAVTEHIVSKLNNIIPGYNVTITNANPTFPFGLELTDVNVLSKGKQLISLKKLSVVPGLAAIMTGKKILHVSGSIFNGSFKSKIDVSKGFSPDKIAAETSITGISIKDIPLTGKKSETKGKVTVDGIVKYSKRKLEKEKTEKSVVTVSKLNVDFFSEMLDMLNLKKLSFTGGSADIIIDKKKIQVKQFDISGSKISGSISGMITSKIPITGSIVNFTGVLKPQPAFLKELEQAMPVALMFIKNSAKASIPFKIKGTIGNPKFSMK